MYEAEHPEDGEKLIFLNISDTQKPFA